MDNKKTGDNKLILEKATKNYVAAVKEEKTRATKNYITDVKEEKTEDKHTPEKAKDDRQDKRIMTIKLTIVLSFVGIGFLIFIMFIDMLFIKDRNITSSPLYIALTGILGAVLSTAIGGIVGSSIS